MADNAPKLTRTELLAAKKKAQELAEQQRALEAQMAALAVGGALASTMERSLGAALEKEHDAAAFERVKEVYDDIKESDLRYDDEDIIDTDFWDHGIAEPQEPGDGEKKWKKHAAAWEAAYRELEVKFIKRAIFAHDLKRVYAKKRAELKAAMASSSAAAAADKKIDVAVKQAVAKAKASKPCGCAKGCTVGCGCRKGGLGCSAGCGCSLINCLNIHSYSDDDAGRAALSAAQDARAKAKLEEAKLKMAVRAENGME